MAEIIIMPKLGFNMSTGKLVRWYKDEGDRISKGDPLFAVETDKTNIDIEATCDGVFREKFIEEGESVDVTLPIAIIASVNEDIDTQVNECYSKLGIEASNSVVSGNNKEENELEILNEISSTATTSSHNKKITPRAKRIAIENNIDIQTLEIEGSGYKGGICEADLIKYIEKIKVKVTPLAKKLAQTESIDINDVVGSGARGKVLVKDVEDKLKQVLHDSVPKVMSANDKEVLEIADYSGVRRIIGDRLSQSKFTAPHLYFTQKINLMKLLQLRREINSVQNKKTSITDYISMAVIKALQKYPEMNASLEGDKIYKYKTVNLGIAVASENGLIVPVVKNSEKMDIVEFSEALEILIDKARNGKLLPDEYTGGTFTVSNLGMYGIENFTAIINPPESGILSVSSTKDEVVVETDLSGNKQMVIRPVMNITLSADHRIIDGLLAAQFVGEIKRLLENPLSLLLK